MNFSAPKLVDCREHGPDAELFIVEGDSAARTLERVCDNRFQAILPMQGKPMNCLKANQSEIEKNLQFAALIKSLGVELIDGQAAGNQPNLFAIEDRDVQLNQLRYQKIILLFDPDADGIHARTLMLFFFFRWLRPLLDAGRIFDTHAPQWMVTARGLPEPVFAATPEYLHRVREHLHTLGATDIRATRFRGLGSINGEILQRQCVDPASRRLDGLSAENAELALAMFENFRIL